MHILRIEHRAPNYEAWKQAFESDPVGRERGGVRRHRVSRQMDDPSYVMVDLEFETRVRRRASGRRCSTCGAAST